MGIMDNFSRQHKEILELVQGITGLLDPDSIQKESVQLRKDLSTLAGKLSIHLAMEDQALYPQLLRSPDKQIVQTAHTFSHQMGDLKESFREYIKSWPTATAIAGDPTGFIKETEAMFAALLNRIQREDQKLYPFAEGFN